MACVPYTVNSGLFINDSTTAWSAAPSTTKGGRTVTLAATGNNPGITVTCPGGSIFHQMMNNHILRYLFIGSGNYLLILDMETGIGPSTCYVDLVDFTGGAPVEKLIVSGLSNGQPEVQYSQGTGSAFLTYIPYGSGSLAEIRNIAIYRSDNGAVLLAGPATIYNPSGQVNGGVTVPPTESGDHVWIHYADSNGSHDLYGDLPLGKCDVQPASRDFGEAVIGGPATLATVTKQFTLKNTGDNCLSIDAIGDVSPFSISGHSKPIPSSLSPAESMTVDVTFAPTSVGPTGTKNLPITRTPANGDDKLLCSGTARNAIKKVSITPASLLFGRVPVGSPKTISFEIKNVGEINLTVSVVPPTAGSPFQWAAWNGTLTPLSPNNSHSVAVTFTPFFEPEVTATLTVNDDAPGNPHTVALKGEGCVANGEIMLPAAAPIDFGEIQRGFRTVRFLTVRNIGDGPLTFTARIAGDDAVLFGLQPETGSVTDALPTRVYTVNPVAACGPGPTGPGEVQVAVAFWANAAPSANPKSAQLVIEYGSGPTGWTCPLTALVVPPISVDAALVLDRSGSMAEQAGAHSSKSQAVIAGGQLFAQLIRPDVSDRLCIVKYNDYPEVIQPIIEITSANQPGIVNGLNSTTLAPAGWTCIAGGVMAGLEQIKTPRQTAPPELTKALVVLTDGNDNRAYYNSADGKWYSVLGGSVVKPGTAGETVMTEPLALQSDVKTYGIGIGKSENIDVGRLDALCTTHGGYLAVVGQDLSGPAYWALEKLFTQIYLNVAGSSQVLDPVETINPGEKQSVEFDLLRGDVSALVVIYDHENQRLPFHVVSPRGEYIELNHVPPGFQLRCGITHTARFIEFLVPQGEPERYAGRWTVVVEHPQRVWAGTEPLGRDTQWGFVGGKSANFRTAVEYGIAVGAGSNFRMQPYVTPGIVHVGSAITLKAVIIEADLPVSGSKVTVKAQSPSGGSWQLQLFEDQAGIDGEYTAQFTHTEEAGGYSFSFHAEGVTRDCELVVRESTLAKYVEGGVAIEPQPDSGNRLADCCRRLFRLLGANLLLLIIVLLLLLFRR